MGNTLILNGKSVLIVDDESDIRELLREKFEKEKCVVYEAANGHEALAIAENKKIDIVLSDIRMPKTGGIDLLKKLKERNQDIRVFLMTGIPNATQEQVYSLGAEALITKPHDINIVTDIVRQILELKPTEIQPKP